ncbi:erythrocyte membrane protein 1 [Plasmodium falciparum RAJ116]|uniref:Erythrocyte membrane protein 1 n=4 Tax=Plasmodium falciparum TaxID=5833 RepID=A0A0L0CRV5_PLAFA|nr:erythrocyte membrane protein 1 [Plasmodium falciparum RAJ116]
MVRQVYNTVNDYTIASDVKHLLDIIGKDVYETVKKVAEQYRSQLKGTLSKAKFEKAPNGQQTPGNTCELKYQWHTNVTNGRSYPCRTGTEKRFSEVSGGECDKNKIRGSKGDNEGACAPYRRLHLCDYNLENINDYKNINNHTLLADVCLAALHEGDSIKGYHGQHQLTNPDSQICTMLARSFADIGDIVRGKDLYLRDKGKRDKLENNLKEIFKKIQEKLIGDAKTHYEDATGNFFQLREDWWYANRETVWKAIRCSAPTDADYFIKTVCSKGTTSTQGKCRCIDFSVPTYFDYVPQYLRWFEEWAEEFCRLRKHKLQNAIKKCRYPKDEHKYCDLNGFDCTKTASGRNKFAPDSDCHECSFSCTPFTNWIDNQKEEFEKQKEKYGNEIKKAEEKIETSNGKINNIYEKDFYKRLKTHYGSVNQFLEKLNKEGICKKPPKVGNETADSVDFTKEDVGEIFSRTKYCRACPLCGLQSVRPPWDPKKDTDCKHIGIKTFDESNSTPINLLVKDVTGTNIVEKLKSLCNDLFKPTIQKWKCHYVGPGEDYCVLQDGNQGKPERTVKQYEAFFNLWINQMLDDSIEWKKQLNKCINNVNKSACIKGCKKPCECFEKWVGQKKTEWDEIEKHFDKQKNIPEGLTHYQVLQYYLNILFKEKIKEAYGEEKCKELEEKLNKIDGSQQGDTEHSEDAIKFLLKHEKGEAKKCKKTKEDCKKPQQPTPDLGRADHHDPRPDEPTASDDADDDEVHDNDIPRRDLNIEVDHLDRKDPEDQVEAPQEPAVPEVKKEEVKVCSIVADIFKETESLNAACTLKYGKTAPTGWKCIPTSGESTKSSDSGSICIPPRRRRLYVGKLETLDEGAKQDDLRTAFIKCAAIETFFSWHEYKMEKKKEKEKLEEQARQNGGLATLDGGEQNPQTQLQSGNIPIDFLRLMFYTLGDYRDILVRGAADDKNGGNNIILNASGTQEEKQKMEKIQEKIDTILKQSGNNKGTSDTQQQTEREKREEFWNQHGKHIWRGMVCALTYKESDKKPTDGKPEKDEQVYKKFFGNTPDKPDKPGTYESTYKYDIVKLKDENSGTQGPKSTESLPSGGDPINNPKLSDFVLRPPYFRYLEEWGQNFCKERKKRLELVKKACRKKDDGDDTFCSGDGHDCTENGNLGHKNMSADPDCPRCYEQCRKYRKWIDLKFEEYHKQENTYKVERQKVITSSTNGGDDDNKKFYEQIKQKTTVQQFLESLNHCKNDQTSEEKDNDNKINFEEPLKTFGPLDYCKTCPPNKVKCNRRGRGQDPCKVNFNGNEWESVFKKTNGNGENSTANITVEMIDRRGAFIKEYMEKKLKKSFKDLFKTSRLFKGIRKQEWECRFNKAENKDVCYLKNFEEKIDLNEYTTFKVFLEYWLENFLYGYYILKKKKKIDLCTKNEGKICNEESKNDCACVKEWVEKKESEWKDIKKHYLKQFSGNTSDVYPLTSFLETWIPKIPVADVQGNVIKLSKFGNSCGCSTSASSEKSKEDAIECMINRLQNKIDKCKAQHSDVDPKTSCEKHSTHVEDEDDTLHEEIEVKAPNICPNQVEDKKKEEEGDECNPATPSPETDDEGDKKENVAETETEPAEEKSSEETEQTPVLKPEEEAPAPDTPPSTPAAPKVEPTPQKPTPPKVDENPFNNPHVKTALVTSTLAWSVGIGFAAFTYFFLKKKTKSSVGNLFQILQIPKSDYGMPTKFSSNRYIPYKSAQYRGKRYIYLEGDSGTDSGYTDHYNDITSSSESEYEELDINDIYPYKSPKYKTLIEVVLEPSKRDTQNDIPSGDTIPTSDTPPPTSGNTIPTSDIPNTPSDTPSPITDEEWNTLKDDFISNMLQNEQEDIPQPDVSKELPLNTHPTPSHDTLDQKPFIMSIHDRNLLNGEEYSYDMINNIGNNDLYSGFDPKSGDNVSYSGTIGSISDKTSPYSGIDLINDSLNSNKVDIYDEVLKRKENELFGTNHPKHTNTHSVTKSSNSDPIDNQLNLFHKWLDRHRDMCEKFSNNKEELLDKLKEQWENKTHSGNKHSDIPSGKLSDTPSDNNIHSDIHPSDIPSGKQSDIPSDNNIHSDIPYVLNSDVSIQIDMDNPNQVDDNTYLDTYPDKSTMDTIMDDLEKYNEPYYDIYYDVNDHDASNVDSNNMDVPSKVKIEMSVKNTQMMEGKYPIGDVWDI